MSESLANQGHSAETGVTRVRMLIGGEWRFGATEYEVFDPYRGVRVARAPESTLQDLDDALSAAAAARHKAAAMPGYQRAALLRKVAALLVERTDQLAYGGIKSSGIGREGPRYAMRDMTEERLVLFNL